MRRSRRRPAATAGTAAPGPEFERRIQTNATLDDLDLELAAFFLRSSPVGSRPVLDALQHYGLIRRQEDAWQVTNAALLLFCRRDRGNWYPGSGLRVRRVAGTQTVVGPSQNVTLVGYVPPPLAIAVDEGMRMVGGQIRGSEALRDIFFRDMPEYPDFAWREVVVNAMAHRDYGTGSHGTEVTFFDDRLEVSSPGGPFAPVTVEALSAGTPGRATRNPMLAHVFADVGIMPGSGTGFARVFKEMSDSSLLPPTVVHQHGHLQVTLRNEPEYAMAGPGWKNVVRSLPVSPDQKRILLARPDGFTHEDYRRLNAVVEGEAKRGVHDLVKKGITTCAFKDGDQLPIYYLTPDLDDTRFFLEDRVPKLREFFQRDPKLRPANYRTLFTAAPAQASRELRQLVELGFLQVVGRGRGKGYLPLAGLRK
ncbi:MAG: hypothetical protein OXQ93_09990 [Gemmatimonadota bacterium]|nr:hypothetical protein [bacterium]MDE2875761.1 hypothetical protein [Gemmatimonadota bacterium]